MVCSRLVHAAALTHSDQREHEKVELSLSNIVKLGKPFLLILCFIFIYFLFFYINIREVLSAWSVGQLVFKPDKPFYTVVGVGSNFLMILIIIQLIWGAFFIKEACKRCLIQSTLLLGPMQCTGPSARTANHRSSNPLNYY